MEDGELFWQEYRLCVVVPVYTSSCVIKHSSLLEQCLFLVSLLLFSVLESSRLFVQRCELHSILSLSYLQARLVSEHQKI